MSRHSIYIDPSDEEKIKTHIAGLRANGATGHEASFSGFVSRLIGLGLIMYDARLKAAEDAKSALDKERLILENVVKTNHAVSYLLRMIMKMDELKGSPLDHKALLARIQSEAENELAEILGDGEH